MDTTLERGSVIPPVTPTPTPTKPGHLRWIIAGAVLLILCIAGAAAYLYFNHFFSAGTPVAAPSLLSELRVVNGAVGSREVGEFDAKGTYHTLPIAVSGNFIEYARQGTMEYALTVDPTTGRNDIVRIRDGHADTLATGTSTKLWLAPAQDGSVLVYAERAPYDLHPATPPDATAIYDPAQWTVHAIDLRTGSTSALVRGSMPRLFMRDGTLYLLYLAPNAVHIRSLAGDGADYAIDYPIDGLWPAEVSRNGAYLALFEQGRMSYQLFHFDLKEGKIVTSALPQPHSELRILTFVKGYALAVAWDPSTKGAYLTAVELENKSKETRLPTAIDVEKVRKLIPSL